MITFEYSVKCLTSPQSTGVTSKQVAGTAQGGTWQRLESDRVHRTSEPNECIMHYE